MPQLDREKLSSLSWQSFDYLFRPACSSYLHSKSSTVLVIFHIDYYYCRLGHFVVVVFNFVIGIRKFISKYVNTVCTLMQWQLGNCLSLFFVHNIISKLLSAWHCFCTTDELAGTGATTCQVTLCIVKVVDDMECSTSFSSRLTFQSPMSLNIVFDPFFLHYESSH